MMESVIDLAKADWQLRGWRPFCWRVRAINSSKDDINPDIGPVHANVPGSVQEALLSAGIIEDWNEGVNSKKIEWIENRHWSFTTVIPAGRLSVDETIVLDARGLDYSGWIVVDDKEVGSFSGTLVPHRFDLSAVLGDGKEHALSIVFADPPREQGQFGYTSQSRFFKPRHSYSWDWCPRAVPIGVWDALKLQTGVAAAISVRKVQTALASDNHTGRLMVEVELDAGVRTVRKPASVIVELFRNNQRVAGRAIVPASGTNVVAFSDLTVDPWWPNGMGDQPLYDLTTTVEVGGEKIVLDCRQVGFKRVEWRQCEGAPSGAAPWICEVNGKPVFLQGVNWTPVRLFYQDSRDNEYEELIGIYKNMGCNLLRVWGGALVEKSVFYNLCDRAGIMVWQEFPLSSSGIDNWPPEDQAAVAEMVRIARTYIQRRAHHASLLLWCGGNELQGALDGGKVGHGKPVDFTHQCIAALQDLVAVGDPGRRFLPTSSSGPRFGASRSDFGKGLHHDVHGPWGIGGDATDMSTWKSYWDADDALFRSEVGMPSAQDLDLLDKYSGGMQVWPPAGDYWRHTAAWWTQADRYKSLTKLPPREALEEYVRLTQAEQADLLAYAARSCKKRFPRCGGFIVWMGHDCFPCPANTSIIDFRRRPKPVVAALKQVFLAPSG